MTYRFSNGTSVAINEQNEHVQTIFSDGLTVDATPNYDAESKARAASLGYRGDLAIWEMTRDHDLFHCIVADWMGWPYSYALRSVAVGKQLDKQKSEWEERMAMGLQRACNVGLAIRDDYVA